MFEKDMKSGPGAGRTRRYLEAKERAEKQERDDFEALRTHIINLKRKSKLNEEKFT